MHQIDSFCAKNLHGFRKNRLNNDLSGFSYLNSHEIAHISSIDNTIPLIYSMARWKSLTISHTLRVG